MHKHLFIYGIFFSVLMACKPISIDKEKRKLAILEQKIDAQFDSLHLISTVQLLNMEDSVKKLSKQFHKNTHDSISIVFSKQMLRNFEHLGLRLASFRNYRDSLQYELEFSEQQIQHLKADLEHRIWDKEQFYIFYVQETKSIRKNEKRIHENNKLMRQELKTYADYKRKILAVIDEQQQNASSEK